MLTTSFPRWQGDFSGSFVESLSISLTELGVKVAVVAPGHTGAPYREERGLLTIYRFVYMAPSRLQVLAYEGGIPYKMRTSHVARLEVIPFLASMYDLACRAAKGCELVHVHWIPTGVVGGAVARRLGVPMVLTVHGSDGAYLERRGLKKRISSFSLQSASHVIAVSEVLERKLLSFGVAPGDVSTIHNGVDPAAFSVVPDETGGRKILWVGRMTEEKGVEFLIRAMKKVTRIHRDALLRLVGDGPERGKLERLTGELGLLNSVSFVGQKSHSEMARFYARCDLVVLPSLSEGLPAALLEAMASGKAVVASKVGGIPELISHGRNGFLVAPGSSDEIADGVIELLGRPEDMARMGVISRRLIENTHSWNSIASQVRSVYASAVGKERR
jgi:glycosyltransferase involved in cell wall biosynthesis